MYSIQSISGNRWRIVDASSRLVFVGNKQQAEDWLDWQENAHPRPSSLGLWWHHVLESTTRPLVHLWRRSTARAAQRVS